MGPTSANAAPDAVSPLRLTWEETELRQRDRTKHAHGLHPYVGKFPPQLVEQILARYLPGGGRVLDPFAGSGTTLVQALESDCSATGIDIGAFNALLARVKTARYDLRLLDSAVDETLVHVTADATRIANSSPRGECPSDSYLASWYAPPALAQLLAFRRRIEELPYPDFFAVVLSRAARSARLARHYQLDLPRSPATEPYYCHKHRRICTPVEDASGFLRRYLVNTRDRVAAFAQVRGRGRANVICADARTVRLPARAYDCLVTSPPYLGLIDYHEQHRYAYELLGLDDQREREIGAAATGRSKAAVAAYSVGITNTLRNVRRALRPGAAVVIVVDDSRGIYPQILADAGYVLEDVFERGVTRRTALRMSPYREQIVVARRTR